MNKQTERQLIAFEGGTRIASGALAEVIRAAKAAVDRNVPSPVLIFDIETSEQLEVDFRGSLADVFGRLPAADGQETQATSEEANPRSPGRPKLGVVAREVTLLPRHWDWLASQPGGASVTIRKLVEQARRSSGDADRVRLAREATYRFMSAMAGNEAGFEEATRALFSGNHERFEDMTRSWPLDVGEHAKQLAGASWATAASSTEAN